jgi:hypothetical protein
MNFIPRYTVSELKIGAPERASCSVRSCRVRSSAGTVGSGSIIVMVSSKGSAVAEDYDTMINSRCSN